VFGSTISKDDPRGKFWGSMALQSVLALNVDPEQSDRFLKPADSSKV